jgi:hypothetical protein
LKKRIGMILFVLWGLMSPAGAGEKIFVTWEGFEADKLASIWLIKRFVAPDGVFLFVPRGQVPREGIPFDVPQARLSRRFNRSTFEVLLDHYRITNRKLSNLGEIIHDIEINTWERKRFRRTAEVVASLLFVMDKGRSNEETVKMARDYFDRLYEGLPLELEKN